MKKLPKFDVRLFAVVLFGCGFLDVVTGKPLTGTAAAFNVIVATAYGFWARQWWEWLKK